MGVERCPSRESLSDWSLGDLADDEADAIADHLDTCVDCERTVANIEGAGWLAGVGAEAVRFAREVECEAFVGTLQLLAPQSRFPYPHSESPDQEHVTQEQVTGRRIRDYQLLGPLGQGAMGAVFQARHTRLNKKVAIKLLREKLVDDPAVVARFQREMQAVGRLEHPNIVQALDAGEADGVSFLAMELVEGIDLARLTSQQRALDVADACEIARQAAIGLQYAHSQGLVHRDVKPSNLMLTRGADGHPRVKILDLGLASIEGLDPHEHLTDDGQLMGTLEFMAPEQAEDTRSVDHRADIYALGATLYRLLTGHVPFDHRRYKTPAQRLRALTQSTAPSIATRRKDLPTGLVDLIDQMLAREPKNRPLDMEQVATRLGESSLDHHLDNLLEQAQQSRLSTHKLTNEFHEPFVDTTPSREATLSVARREEDQDSTRVPCATKSTGSRLLLAIFAVPLVAVLAGTIWLQTEGGYIRIETVDPSIDVSVQVLRDGESVDTVRVGREQSRFWYRSGQYEIRFPEGVGDGLEISTRRVTVTRGNEPIVSISSLSQREELSEKPQPTGPRVVIVTTSSDEPSTAGSLRDAVENGGTDDVIRFDPSLAGKTIRLNGDALLIKASITIDASDLASPVTIDAGRKSRVIQMYNTRNLTLKNLVLTKGNTQLDGGGIAIRKERSRVELIDCVISECYAADFGGAIRNYGHLKLTRCCLLKNSSEGAAGLANWSGTARLENCLIAGNSTVGDQPKGVIQNVNNGSLELIHCTVVDNTGNGINSTGKAYVLLDSTIVANNEGSRRDLYISSKGHFYTRGANIVGAFNCKVIGDKPLSIDPMLATLGN